jgi:hypothetical protein
VNLTRSRSNRPFPVGHRFVDWEVVESPAQYYATPSQPRIHCRCRCGTEDYVLRCNLVSGASRRCKACGNRTQRQTKSRSKA